MDEELVFQYLSLNLQLDQPFGVLERPGNGSAVILIRDQNAHWVLGRKKDFHLEGLGRLVGGGIDEGEHPVEAAQRELVEETGLNLDISKLVPLVHVEIAATLPSKKTAEASIFVFYAQAYQDLRPQDDIDQLLSLDDHQFNELIKKYQNLPQDVPLNSDNQASWFDYGQVWGPIHAAAVERARQLAL